MTRPIHVQSSAGTFGIRFRPGRAALALGAPLTLVTDARVPLRDLTKRFGTIEPEIDSIEAALRSLFAEATPDRRVDAAVGLIARTGGRSSIDSVASEAGVSRQHLARAFAYHVGLTPKMFARVIRFAGRSHSRGSIRSAGPISRRSSAILISRISSPNFASSPATRRFHFSYRDVNDERIFIA